ncbi:transglutaminaseTgpA domain-containing protein [Microbacterium sp.]|uniref:transglutaminase family protein n=1 Tax=Microbacterium sp. TaxID=51671 RepID=UPI003341E846
MNERAPLRRWVIDLVAMALLVAVAAAGFWPTFGGPSYLGAAIGGILLGLAIAAVCAWRRWGILLVAGLTVVGYFLFGGALALPATTVAGFVPTIDTLTGLAVGVVTSWKQLLTTVAPVAVADGHALVPFLVTLLAAVTAGSLALRLRRPAWALIPAGTALMLAIVLGVPQPAFPLVQGIVFAVVAVAWLSLRTWWAPEESAVEAAAVDAGRSSQMRIRRLVGAAAVLAIASGAGVAASAIAAPAQPRHVFRDVIIPPFDVRDYASPLQAFRKNVRDDREKTLFTVTGMPEGARIRIGAMDQYDGVVYNVTDGGPGSSSAFTPLRTDMSPDAQGAPTTVHVEIGDYRGVWVPDTGAVSEIRYSGGRAEDLRRNTYYNTSTGTAVAVPGLRKGDAYTLQTIIQGDVDDKELTDAKFGSVRLPKQSDVPDEISSLAADTVADAETPIEQVRALESFLADGGYFSHGLENEAVSRAGHGAERISTLLGGQQMIGDDEQYAAAMALMARAVDIPARVVMGYYPDEDRAKNAVFAATGDDVHAWVEVNFAGYGWLPFDPTPPKDKVPNQQNTKPKVDPKPQVLQPPPPPQEPVDLPPTLPDDREPEDDTPNLLGIIATILAIGGVVLAVLAILASPFIVIGAWKAARRRGRRSAKSTADRISGGWDELTDRAVDYGARVAPGATRVEDAATVSEALSAPAVTTLADRADAQVFGPSEPSAEEVDAFWKEVDEIVGGMGAEAGFWRRMRARLSVRSLLGGGRIAGGLRNLKDAAAARVRREPGTIDTSTTPAPESETT